MSLEQAIVRPKLFIFDFGGLWTSSFGRFTPHLCLIPSMYGMIQTTTFIRYPCICLLIGWSAHELVFSGLSWPTIDKPFWLVGTVGNIFSLIHNSLMWRVCH